MNLLEKNINFWFKKTKGQIKLNLQSFDDYELIKDGDSVLNYRYKELPWRYDRNAILETDTQLKFQLKEPSRLIFATPDLVPKGDKVRVKYADQESKSYLQLTDAYIDQPTDDHYDRFRDAYAQALANEGISIANKGLGDHTPYYLAVYGVGLGYHLPHLIKRYQPEHLILVETNLLDFVASYFTIDWESVLSRDNGKSLRVTIHLGTDTNVLFQKISAVIQKDSLAGMDGLLAYLHRFEPVLKMAHAEFHSQKAANIPSFIGFIPDEYNMLRNSFLNLSTGTQKILTKVSDLQEKPVMIVGSGPSLSPNLELIKRTRDKYILISSGSSLKVLLKNGIRPDFHCNLERAQSIYERHVELKEDGNDLTDIYAVMTTTIWKDIDKFFKGCIYFFRPALSPLAIFAESDEQILHNEGPQVTNTAFAYARHIGSREIYLLGVDLGSSDLDKPRDPNAWKGIRPRQLTIPIRGNKGITVFTDQALMQQKKTLEIQIHRTPGMKVFNLGSGVRIDGAKELDPADFEKNLDTYPLLNHKQIADKLYQESKTYSKDLFKSNWEASNPREAVAAFVSKLKNKIISEGGFTGESLRDIELHCGYMGKPIKAQFMPRLLRGSILRMIMYAYSVYIRTSPDKSSIAFNLFKDVFLKELSLIERECYSLIDRLESESGIF